MTSPIYLSSPDVGALEEEYVVAAIRSGWIAPLGPDVDAFEAELRERIGVEHVVALNSGTSALHLALLGLGVGRGDVVVTSTMTFAATTNAIRYVDAEPYFVDCDPVTGNIDPDLLRTAIERVLASGRRIGAILPVDLLGKAMDYTAVEAIADEFGIPLIADAAESLGASHRGRPAGSFGRASIMSFNGNKIMTTSCGGALLTDDAELAANARYRATQARQPVAHYEHIDVGYNYRMSNLLAALGRAQLVRLDGMVARRRALRARYRELFAGVDGVEIFGGVDEQEDNCWLTSILIDSAVTGWTPEDLAAAMKDQNLECRPLWKPMHLQPVFSGYDGVITGAAQRLFETGVSLPSGSVLTDDDIDRVIVAISGFVGID